MMNSDQHISAQVETVLRELIAAGQTGRDHIVVIGCSTSEITGRRIGTSGTAEAARAVYEGVSRVQRESGFSVAFQCCEHLNRALVMERKIADQSGLEIVAAIPMLQAGGAMAAYAYTKLDAPCLVENVQAHAGIDIGDTLIGMHLKRVAVPFRPSIRQIGGAHVNAAFTRPKLIGGERAVYSVSD